jgi:hypothetical protein
VAELVQILQALSGVLWLAPAVFLTPRILGAWRQGASRTVMLSAPIGFVAWLMFGFSVRWFVWPHAIATMAGDELLAWSALYALSGFLAVWVFIGAFQTRGQ